ncbi:MAG: magnesium transporter [Oligoflexia bacterium]|nr:magnesium transporter [Oligoflexia bacterium]
MAEITQFVEAIRRLARRGATSALRRTVQKSRAQDIADAMGHLPPQQMRMVYACIVDDQVAAEVLTQVDPNDLGTLVAVISFDRLVSLLDLMEVDDEADIIAGLPEDLSQRVLKAIHGEDKEFVEDILAWPEDSAGGIMQPIAFRLLENQTCRGAIGALHDKHDELESIYYIYVENDYQKLVGVTSLRQLLTNAPSTTLREIMVTDVISVPPQTDQEEVARVVSRYDLLAIPVVDDTGELLGIVTIDDIVDVIREEAAEDMMLMAGVGPDIDALDGGVLRSTRQRLPWLLVTMFGGILISEIFTLFQTHAPQAKALISFVPVMIGMGGNVGTQAATITVRNIALGRSYTSGMFPQLWRQARIGMLIGLVFAVVVGGFAIIRDGDMRISLAIGGSGVVQLMTAATVGTLIPMLMQRLRIDPAVATGPLVSSTLDLLGISLFFVTSDLIMRLPLALP